MHRNNTSFCGQSDSQSSILEGRSIICGFSSFCLSDDMCSDTTKFCDVINQYKLTNIITGWSIWSWKTVYWHQMKSSAALWTSYTKAQLVFQCQQTVVLEQIDHPVDSNLSGLKSELLKPRFRCCFDKAPAGSPCLIGVGFTCASGNCGERFPFWKIFLWPPAALSKIPQGGLAKKTSIMKMTTDIVTHSGPEQNSQNNW